MPESGVLEGSMKHIALGILAVFVLGSCNTTIGIGRDLRILGTGIEEKAQGKPIDDNREGEYQGQENLPTY